jgi:hypothetical protein
LSFPAVAPKEQERVAATKNRGLNFRLLAAKEKAGLMRPASENELVAGVGFEPTTFGL